ncbi:uncharacterized protein B0H18DRAFT_1038525, partial [Fomitopsis serialis]|uniref:uncharacterized protein n=1 Tax=Fomitopsis serialis TaxID=139415 RepID=UPI002008BB6B
WAHQQGGTAGGRHVQTGSMWTLPSAGTREHECGGPRARRMEGGGMAARTTGAPLTHRLACTLARLPARLRKPPHPLAHYPTHPPIRSPTRAWTRRPAVPARDPHP